MGDRSRENISRIRRCFSGARDVDGELAIDAEGLTQSYHAYVVPGALDDDDTKQPRAIE